MPWGKSTFSLNASPYSIYAISSKVKNLLGLLMSRTKPESWPFFSIVSMNSCSDHSEIFLVNSGIWCLADLKENSGSKCLRMFVQRCPAKTPTASPKILCSQINRLLDFDGGNSDPKMQHYTFQNRHPCSGSEVWGVLAMSSVTDSKHSRLVVKSTLGIISIEILDMFWPRDHQLLLLSIPYEIRFIASQRSALNRQVPTSCLSTAKGPKIL